MILSKTAALDLLRQQVEESCTVKRGFSTELLEAVLHLAERTVSAFQKRNKVLLMGNGGSAADAQHIAAELVGRFRLQRKGLPAIALTANSSTLTAISNDFGFENSFARQLEAFGNTNDVVIAISTSGRSPNIVRAVETARTLGCYTAALTGRTGGDLMNRVDLLLAVPSESTQRIQEAHSLLGHMYCDLVERLLLGTE
jgi:D-sedoheptulose 7-phosphate isomerase